MARVFRAVAYTWLVAGLAQKAFFVRFDVDPLGSFGRDIAGLTPTDWNFLWVVAVTTALAWLLEWIRMNEAEEEAAAAARAIQPSNEVVDD
jgi:hypothetical protein